MAVNRAYNSTPGSTQTYTLEQLVEPGQPRQYWNPAKSAWETGPPVATNVLADPDQPGQFLVQIPTTLTASWRDGGYRLVVTDINSALKDSIIYQDTFLMIAGDDGGLGVPSVTIPFPLAINGVAVPNSSLQIYNARMLSLTAAK